MFACIDLGGTTITGGLGEADGRLAAHETIATESQLGPAGVLDRIAGLVESFGGAAKPEALGIGVPGLVDFAAGSTLFLPNFPTQWRGVAVRETLSKRLGCPVFLLNDARAAALGEMRFGHGRTAQSMVYFTLGTGIGGAVVIDGKLRLGPLGAAGELGHQTVAPGGPLCGCGNRGCLEAVASAPALTGEGVRLLRSGQAPRLHELTGGDAARVTPKTMAECGDMAVADAIERVARLIGLGAANMVTALHPELVVLGGGMSALDELLLGPVREEIRARVRMFPVDDVRVERSMLGDRAGLLGALALAASSGVV